MRSALLAALLALTACAPQRSARRIPPPPRGAVVARVDGVEITEDLVRATALRERVSARAALDMLLDEAILAREAARRGLAGAEAEEDARWHGMVRRIIELEVDEPFAPSRLPRELVDAFVAEKRAARCHDGLRRVAHAVFRVPERAGVVAQEAARARAEAFRASLLARHGDRPTEGQLREAVEALRDPNALFEPLPAIDRNAGMVSGGGVVPAFAEAVWAIERARPLSPAFRTSYGYHVALLVEEVPPSGVSCEAIRPQLAAELSELRRNGAIRALLTRLRARAEVRVDHAALRSAGGRSGP